ncbi:MAG: glycosyltransferase family 4 protein [Thermoplasmata archaeon]
MEKNEIVFVSRAFLRFQNTVIGFLSQKYIVKCIKFQGFLSILEILKTLKQNNLCIIYFAGRSALVTILLSKLKRCRTVVIAAGYDIAKEHQLNTFDWIRIKIYSKPALIFADYVIVVSKYLEKEMLSFVTPKKHFLSYGPNSVDVTFFTPNGKKDENLIISVGAIEEKYLKKKGFHVFVECAKRLPNLNFIWVGFLKDPSFLKKINVPPNLKILHDLSDTELRDLMRKASVYCQLSKIEGFGMAIAEAMACECVPVVTKGGAIPELVGDTGIYVHYCDVEGTIKGIKLALSKRDLGKKARERIVQKFSKEVHKDYFLNIIDGIYKNIKK